VVYQSVTPYWVGEYAIRLVIRHHSLDKASVVLVQLPNVHVFLGLTALVLGLVDFDLYAAYLLPYL